MRKIVRKGVNIDKLAHELSIKKGVRNSVIKYKEGLPEDKIWVNFQTTKGNKRKFNELCTNNHINASAFLRTCIDLFNSTNGDVGKTLNKIKDLGVKSDESIES